MLTTHQAAGRDGHLMMIGTYEALDDLARDRRDRFHCCGDDDLAHDLTVTANDYLVSWEPRRHALSRLLAISLRLDEDGLIRTGHTITYQGPAAAARAAVDHYSRDGATRVTISTANDHSPVQVTVSRDGEMPWRAELGHGLPAADAAALITAVADMTTLPRPVCLA